MTQAADAPSKPGIVSRVQYGNNHAIAGISIVKRALAKRQVHFPTGDVIVAQHALYLSSRVGWDFNPKSVDGSRRD